MAKREALRREKRKSIVPSQPLDSSTKATLATEAKAELGEDALKQAKDAFEAADVNNSNDLDREEVEKVLLSMGISSASELAEIFLSSDRMDFDRFCIMIAPETARGVPGRGGWRHNHHHQPSARCRGRSLLAGL